ncbi:hypothetical protein, partial [Raoultella ornithinolytica]|uniref:hypothetical protein n=1 Tax=Raoultella ornithinolytica TaxID=54291 RepID=UPI00384BC891
EHQDVRFAAGAVCIDRIFSHFSLQFPLSTFLRGFASLFSDYPPSSFPERDSGHTGISELLSRIQTGNLSSEIPEQRHTWGIQVISSRNPSVLSQESLKHQTFPVATPKRHVVNTPNGRSIAETARDDAVHPSQLTDLPGH